MWEFLFLYLLDLKNDFENFKVQNTDQNNKATQNPVEGRTFTLSNEDCCKAFL